MLTTIKQTILKRLSIIILVTISILLILLGSVYISGQLLLDRVETLRNTSQILSQMKVQTSEIKRLDGMLTLQLNETEKIKTKYESNDALKTIYFNGLCSAIEIRYLSSNGVHKGKKDKNKVMGLINAAFTCSQELYGKKLIPFYGKNIRDCALNALGEIGNETGYDIYDEYDREINTDKSYDYGAWRINDVHWKHCNPSIFEVMYKLGIWKQDGDNYICHPITNCKARMIIVNDRIKRNWDSHNMDWTLRKILEKVDGWQEVYK